MRLGEVHTLSIALAMSSLITGCSGEASAEIGTTCTGGVCSTTAKGRVTVTFQIDHEGNERKELYAYVGDNLVELDFSQFGIHYSGQNAFVVNQPGYVDVVLKSFGSEVARRTFAYHIDAQNMAKFNNPNAVKSWILTFNSIDEFKTELSDIQANMGSGSVTVTSSLKYGGATYASSTYTRDGGLEPEYPIIIIN